MIEPAERTVISPELENPCPPKEELLMVMSPATVTFRVLKGRPKGVSINVLAVVPILLKDPPAEIFISWLDVALKPPVMSIFPATARLRGEGTGAGGSSDYIANACCWHGAGKVSANSYVQRS